MFLEKRSENRGVFIPSCLIENSRPFLAIDNTNIKIDTPTGKHQRQKLLCVFKEDPNDIDKNDIDQTFYFMKI